MHKQKLVIIGASGHGKVVADIAFLTEKYQQIFFIDDNAKQQEVIGVSVIGGFDNADTVLQEAEFFVAIGNAKIRQQLLEKLVQKGADLATLIHPSAVIGSNVEIGVGSVVMAGTVLNAECKIGRGCIINTCSSIDHDCKIGDYVHVSVGAHLAGNVTVGDSTWIGAGAVVNNNVNITQSCMIGSGAIVLKDIQESGTYVGVPAKKVN